MPCATTRLVGGVHRDVSGRGDEPLRFYLSVDRELASGKLDNVPVDEAKLLDLVVEAGSALKMLQRERRGR